MLWSICCVCIYCRSLYGASNKPWKVCRTVICGQSEVDVSRILYILTYFIRCKDLVKSTALVDREDEKELDSESPRPRRRLGAFSQSDFSHRLSLSPEAENCTQFSFLHESPPTSTFYCSGCRGSISSPLQPKEECKSVVGDSGFSCSASISAHCTDVASKHNFKPEDVEIEGGSDSGVDDPYKDEELRSFFQSEMRSWWVERMYWYSDRV